MSAILEAAGIVKTYVIGRRRLTVLDGIDVSIATGETMAIVGPSGAGKSTLLHILGGLDKPTEGTVCLQGRDIYALSARERSDNRARRIGFVFQSYHLLPELDLAENVMLPAMSVAGIATHGATLRRRAVELLEAVGLAERVHHTPMELSGGEQQRAALARALMNEPDILLADEPTGNLDTHTGALVLHYLFELTNRLRHTLVLVTHNTELAGQCDRTVHLVDGRIRDITKKASA